MKQSLSLLSVILFLGSLSAMGQVSISGTVLDDQGTPLVGANVVLQPINTFAVTGLDGEYTFKNVEPGTYEVTISFVGIKTFRQSIEVQNADITLSPELEDDPLNLESIVVTGTFDPRSQLMSSTAITTIDAKTMQSTIPRGTAELLQLIPGTFTDPSAGDVFTRVYSRGISASAEDDMGWYYVSLQEDGLPVSLVQHSYYAPDLFQRTDLFTNRVEGIRGGSAAITALNGPGGIYNFISQGPTDKFSGEVQLQGGLQGESNPSYRADAKLGGPLGKKWFLNAGGHYRQNDGARNTDFKFSKGGQFRFNLIKKYQSGSIKFYGKLLDDFTNRWTGVAATNWDDPEAAFGQDFRSTALLMPAFKATIPDGRNLPGGTNSFDPSRGVHAQDRAIGMDLNQNLGSDWSLRFNTKYSNKSADWQTSISNAFVSLNNPLAYFISGAEFPVGQVVFRDAQSGSEIARLDNSGLFNGDPIQYLTEGSLPNDAIMGTSTWYKQNEADEWMGQLTIRKETDKHDLNLGLSSGYSSTSMFTQGSFAFVTYEPNPRMLEVTVENPGQPVVALSDQNGVSNYGGLFFVNSRADVTQVAAFINDLWKVEDRLHFDLGLRFETINHNGSKDRFAPFTQDGGLDGDPTTAYDNGILSPTGERDNFDYNYNYLSYSLGLNYKLQNEAALFARFSSGNKAPELNYYFNNFSNVPINQKGEIQKIQQAEVGLKFTEQNISFTTTAFLSQLKDIGTTNFEFDQDNNSIFYTPVQFNNSRTIGMEWESSFSPMANLDFSFNGTLQRPIATDWTVYDAAGSVDTSDDNIIDFSDNDLPFNPKLMFNLGAEYQKSKFSTFLRWQYMGKREGNVANAFQLAAYSTFNLGLGYNINQHLSLSLLGSNIFNSDGLANFFGENSFGASANGVTSDVIEANPDASFVVVPILPRAMMLRVNYRF